MPILRFKGFNHTPTYNGPTGSWSPGDEKEISAADAARLLGTFPDAFEAVGSAPSKPAKTRAVKSPTKRRSASTGAKATKTTKKATK